MRYTSPVCKMHNSPKPIFNDEYNKLINQVDMLDEKLDSLRKDMGSWFGTTAPAGYEHVRMLRKEIAGIMDKANRIFEMLNPEYMKFWGIPSKNS